MSEILEQADLSGAFGRGAIARHRDEVERDRAWGHGAGEVGEKDEGALQHGDKVQRLVARIVLVDLRGHLVDARTNLFCGE